MSRKINAEKIKTDKETGVAIVPAYWLNEILDVLKELVEEKNKEEQDFEYMSIRETIGKYSVTHRTVKKLVEGGKLDAVRVGKRLMVKIPTGKDNILTRR